MLCLRPRNSVVPSATSSPIKAKPKLHILAIGINAYVDRGSPLRFGQLGLAVKDATAFGAAMEKAAGNLYKEVRVTLALDRDATSDTLEKTVAKIASEVHPRDSFILFAAGHGTSENGRFYFIPQDYQSGPAASGERHGVFTWAVLDALRKGDSNGNGLIELSELVLHVQNVVPKVAAGFARAATREPVRGKQAARFGSRGEDFPIAQRLQ